MTPTTESESPPDNFEICVCISNTVSWDWNASVIAIANDDDSWTHLIEAHLESTHRHLRDLLNQIQPHLNTLGATKKWLGPPFLYPLKVKKLRRLEDAENRATRLFVGACSTTPEVERASQNKSPTVRRQLSHYLGLSPSDESERVPKIIPSSSRLRIREAIQIPSCPYRR